VAGLADDPELLKGFREGRREALERIYRDNVRAVDGYLRTLARTSGHAGLVQTSWIADLIQEVFIRAFSSAARKSYDGVRSFAPYLLTITRNAFIDCLRASGREIPKSADELAVLVEQTTDAPEPGLDGPTLSLLEAYVRGLPPELEAVYHQRFVLGRSQEAASAGLGISRRAIRTAEDRLRKGLRKALVRAGVRLRDLADQGEEFPTRLRPAPVRPGGRT
jgi:RNA polymerase sigma factor (sigma-70 family)